MMKFTAQISIAFCLVFLILGCQAVPKQNTSFDNWQAKLPGTYRGVIFSSGIETPGITRIYENANGILNGDYEFIEKYRKISGVLYDFKIISPLRVKCKWRDKYGTGDLFMSFNDTVTEFNGMWNAQGYENKFLWNGSKQMEL